MPRNDVGDAAKAYVNQVVLVTGSNGGIGASMVEAYAQAGATVIGADRAGDVPDSAAAYFDLDVTDEVAVTAVIADVVARFGRIDALVHAAGVLGETPHPLETSTAEFQRIMTINATGTFTIVRETAQAMLDADTRGTILLFSSVAAKEGRTTYLPYNASKIAVLHIMWSMAQILGPSGSPSMPSLPDRWRPTCGRNWRTLRAPRWTQQPERVKSEPPNCRCSASPAPTRSPTPPCSSPTLGTATSPVSVSTSPEAHT